MMKGEISLQSLDLVHKKGIALRDKWVKLSIEQKDLDQFSIELEPYLECIPELRRMLPSLHLTKGSITHLISTLAPMKRRLDMKALCPDTLNEKTDSTKQTTSPLGFRVALDNLRSALNVGSIFRTAECMNFERLDLCGYTPTPQNPKVLKSAKNTCD